VRGLNFHVEGLNIEVGANNWSGGAQPPAPPPHFNHCLWRYLQGITPSEGVKVWRLPVGSDNQTHYQP